MRSGLSASIRPSPQDFIGRFDLLWDGEGEPKLAEYNAFYSTVAKNQISSREVNGRLVLEGIIKVYWGTEASVRLKEWDDARVISRSSARSRKVMSVGPNFASTAGQGLNY